MNKDPKLFFIFPLILLPTTCHCQMNYCSKLPNEYDILFLLDSTMHVGTKEKHKRMLEFVVEFAHQMRLIDGGDNGNKIAFAQFTPELKFEFGFDEFPSEIYKQITMGAYNEEIIGLIKGRILNLPYEPSSHQMLNGGQCLGGAISLNSVVNYVFGEHGKFGNRPSTPDLIFLVTSSTSRPVENCPGEAFVQPQAPIHFYIITIGGSEPNHGTNKDFFKPLEFTATTVHLGVRDYSHLNDLIDPLCQSVHSFLGDRAIGGPLPASFCFICLVLLAVCSAFLVALLCWAANKYKNDGFRYQNLVRMEQEKLCRLNDHFQRKLQKYKQQLGSNPSPMIERTISELPLDHPALKLPPIDVLLLVDGSGSIAINTFGQVKQFLQEFVGNINIAPGQSKIACIVFAAMPNVYFGFNEFYTITSVREALEKLPYLGGGTRLAKALAFASGMMAREQIFTGMKVHEGLPAIKHERLQVIILVSDGTTDDNFDHQAMVLNDRLHIKIAAVVTKKFFKDRLVPIVRYEDAIFTLLQIEALSNWLWNQQKQWNEKFGSFIEMEKSFITAREAQ